MHSFYLDSIRKFEGFTPQATWDYAQLSNGYGTRAQFAGEQIDRSEAERRFQSAIADARATVERHAAGLDEGTKAALTSLTFNSGETWVRSGLGDAVRRGDLGEVRALFCQYCRAGGEVLPGLVSRRIAEALWIGNPEGESVNGPPPDAANASIARPGFGTERAAVTAATADTEDGGAAHRPGKPASIGPGLLRQEPVSADGSLPFGSPASAGLDSIGLAEIVRLVTLDSAHRLLVKGQGRQGERSRVRET